MTPHLTGLHSKGSLLPRCHVSTPWAAGVLPYGHPHCRAWMKEHSLAGVPSVVVAEGQTWQNSESLCIEVTPATAAHISLAKANHVAPEELSNEGV